MLQPPRSRRRVIPAFAGAVAIFVGGAAYLQFGVGAPPDIGVSALATKASDAVGNAVVGGVSKASEAVGLGRLAPAESSSISAPALPPSAKAGASTAAPGRFAKPQPMPLRVFDLSPAVSAALASEVPPETSTVTVIAEPENDHEMVSDTSVYSAANADVTPPVGVRPQLPAVLPADVSKNQLGQIELTILSDGTVGAVKLLGGRRSVLEGMLLSAAKAWTFTPAMKDGHPVAYKKIVWLALR